MSDYETLARMDGAIHELNNIVGVLVELHKEELKRQGYIKEQPKNEK